MSVFRTVLTASLSNESYSIEEINSSLEVCVVLEGLIDRDVTIILLTNDVSATGMVHYLLLKRVTIPASTTHL